MTPRRGFTLIETIAAVGVLAMLAALTGPMFHGLMSQAAFARGAVETDAAVRRAVQRLQADMDTADRLACGPGRVLIGSSQGAVCYETGQYRLTRRVSAQAGPAGSTRAAEPQELTVWAFPHARIEWTPYLRDGKAVGLVVHTGIEPPAAGGARPRLANTRVLFLGAGADGRANP